ncbi:MAG TPA: hypothetical protein DHU96_08140, partial [Actinobacteria bacterium]|nr:hypothetical protein [Actinomycetota bacterium]
TPARHRKPSPLASALQHKPTQIVAGAAGLALIAAAAAWPAVANSPGGSSRPATLDQASVLGMAGAGPGPLFSRAAGSRRVDGRAAAGFPIQPGSTGQHLSQPPKAPAAQRIRLRHQPAALPPVYRNPLRSVGGLIPERIDMGADFGGSGPVYALGNAVITSATGSSAGWPGGGWITYRLTDGPAAGLMVYVAEDVTPTVTVGQHVSSSTVIANMVNGGDGIETGWAQASTFSAESQLPEAGSIDGNGPFPTAVGLNFEELLQTLGVAAANNRSQSTYGILPPSYPASWAAATAPQK